MTTHIDPCDLVAYGHGQLSRARAAHVREHAFHCSACGDQLAAVLLLREGALIADQTVAEVVDFPVSARRAPNTLRWATAAAAMLLVAFGAYRYSDPTTTIPAPRSADAVVQDATPEFSLEYVIADQAEAERLQNFATVLRELHGIPNLRVAEGTSPDNTQLLAEGVAAILAGNLLQAIDTLSPFETRFHEVGTMLLGAALYLERKDPARAIEVLEAAAGDAFQRRPPEQWNSGEAASAYYLARLYAARGDVEAAQRLALQVAETGANNRSYGDAARSFAEQLQSVAR